MHYHLTPAYEEQVVQFVRAGGYDWVASEAAGVPRVVFEGWLRRGTRQRRQPYRRFHERVMQARAQACLKAEIDARDQDPRFWLKHGPGRERLDYPGWTNPARPLARVDSGEMNIFDVPEFLSMTAALLGVLSAYPEAHAAVVKQLPQASGKEPERRG